MRWQKKLGKKDMKHLKQTMNGRPTLKGLKSNIQGQKDTGITCWDCRRIAGKLGLEV